MSLWQAFFAGMMTALLPSLIVLVILLCSAPTHPDNDEENGL